MHSEPLPIRLRPIDDADIPRIVAWRNDPEVALHLARTSATTEEIAAWLAVVRATPTERAYTIEADGVAVGYAVINGVDSANRRCEVGIVIGDRGRWGAGIGTSVARSLARIAFTELGLHRVAAVASERNAGSIACFRKAGYREEGRLRQARRIGDDYVDLVLLSMLAHESRGSAALEPAVAEDALAAD